MNTQVTDIRQAIQSLSGFGDLQYEGVVCNVSAIDLVAFTCTCTPINGDADFFDVLLNADADKGFTLIPTNNSVVIVQQTSQANAYVSMVSKVDQVYIAGDVNGGLVKIDDLKLQYDAMVVAFKTAIAAGFTALSGLDGGASLSAFNAAATSVLSLNKTTLENTNVKHGNG
jgi:hypothetical protein